MSNKFKALFLLSLLAFDSECSRLAVTGTFGAIFGAAVHPEKIRRAGEHVKNRAARGLTVMLTAANSSGDTNLAAANLKEETASLQTSMVEKLAESETRVKAHKESEQMAENELETEELQQRQKGAGVVDFLVRQLQQKEVEAEQVLLDPNTQPTECLALEKSLAATKPKLQADFASNSSFGPIKLLQFIGQSMSLGVTLGQFRRQGCRQPLPADLKGIVSSNLDLMKSFLEHRAAQAETTAPGLVTALKNLHYSTSKQAITSMQGLVAAMALSSETNRAASLTEIERNGSAAVTVEPFTPLSMFLAGVLVIFFWFFIASIVYTTVYALMYGKSEEAMSFRNLVRLAFWPVKAILCAFASLLVSGFTKGEKTWDSAFNEHWSKCSELELEGL